MDQPKNVAHGAACVSGGDLLAWGHDKCLGMADSLEMLAGNCTPSVLIVCAPGGVFLATCVGRPLNMPSIAYA